MFGGPDWNGVNAIQENKHFMIKLMTLSILKFRAIKQGGPSYRCRCRPAGAHAVNDISNHFGAGARIYRFLMRKCASAALPALGRLSVLANCMESLREKCVSVFE